MVEKLRNYLYKSPYFIRNTGINVYGFYLYRRRFNREFWNLYEHLKIYQYSSPEKIKNDQFKKLKEIVKYAYENIDYYKMLLNEHSIKPSDIISFEEFRKIPILTRDIVIKNFDSLISKNFPISERIMWQTSGTTGEKLYFYLPKALLWQINFAHLYLLYSWGGIKPGDRRVTLGARMFTKIPPYYSYNHFEHQLLLSIHHLNNETVKEYIRKIDSFKPLFIQGHPSGIHFIAQHILEKGLTLSFKPKAIFTTGETLFPDQKADIENAFNSKLFETYGMGESVVMAGTCADNLGFHEISNYGYIEILPTGEIVGTSLYNKAMPFIRYKIGDVAEPVDASLTDKCGISYPLKIKRIFGRMDDRIVLRDGKIVFPVTFRMGIKPFLFIGENYQLIQHSLKEFELVLQLNKHEKERIGKIKNKAKEILGNYDISLDMRIVDKIKSKGKMKNIISKVRNE